MAAFRGYAGRLRTAVVTTDKKHAGRPHLVMGNMEGLAASPTQPRQFAWVRSMAQAESSYHADGRKSCTVTDTQRTPPAAPFQTQTEHLQLSNRCSTPFPTPPLQPQHGLEYASLIHELQPQGSYTHGPLSTFLRPAPGAKYFTAGEKRRISITFHRAASQQSSPRREHN